MSTVHKIEIELTDEEHRYLRALENVWGNSPSSVRDVVQHLVRSAVDGLRRPGAWERGWVTQAFGDAFKSKLEQHPKVKWYERPREDA